MFGWFKRANEEINVPEQDIEDVERRCTERADTYADVVAKSNSGRFLKKGIALDLSANGARLRFENGDFQSSTVCFPSGEFKNQWRYRTISPDGVDEPGDYFEESVKCPWD